MFSCIVLCCIVVVIVVLDVIILSGCISSFVIMFACKTDVFNKQMAKPYVEVPQIAAVKFFRFCFCFLLSPSNIYCVPRIRSTNREASMPSGYVDVCLKCFHFITS